MTCGIVAAWPLKLPPPPRTEPVPDASPLSACELASSADPGPKTWQPASLPGPDRFFACVAAGFRPVTRRLRLGLLPALLCLPLLLGLAAPAAAQTSVTVPIDWALKPADVEGGESFRLLFATSTGRDAQSTDIADYNAFVQTRAKAGHGAITDAMGDQFKVVGSTASVDARDNTGTTGAGVPIYWLNGAKVADDYADFYDGSWDSSQFRNESGNTAGAQFSLWTGSNEDGTKHSFPLGHNVLVRGGNPGPSEPRFDAFSSAPTTELRLYGLSPLFKVANPTNVWLEATELRTFGDPPVTDRYSVDEVTVGEDGSDSARITVGLSRRLAAGETVTAPLTVSGAGISDSDYTISLSTASGRNTGVTLNTSTPYSAARPAVVFTGHATNYVRFATLLVRAVQDTANEGAETLTLGIGAVTDNLADGTNVPAGISTARVKIEDDEPTVSLAVPDSVAVEGDANRAAFVELRLAGPVPGGQTLNVTYSLNLNATVSLDGTQSGRTISATRSSTSTGTVAFTGPLADKPTARLKVAASNNTVNGFSGGIATAEFKLTGATGISGVGTTAAAGRGAKLFVIDSATRNGGQYKTTTMQVEGGTAHGSHNVWEGNTATLLLSGTAGPRQTPKGPTGGYEVLVGVQNLTTDFGDLGRARAKTHGGAQYAYVAYYRRDSAANTDYYKVYVTGGGKPGAFEVPVLSDGGGEGGEQFRVFIAETPRYMGVGGRNNDLFATASMDFTIPAHGGFARAEAAEAPVTQAPTEAVANLKATEVDDANAKVTWDAVAHARSYQVDWEAEGGSGLVMAGGGPSVTGTSVSIRHDAPERMTLTVTVTPEYVDTNGNVVALDSLAGTATLEVGPQPLGGGGTNGGGDGGGVDAGEGDAQASATAACVSADLMQHVEARIEIAITDRWVRIRNALIGQPNAIALTEVKEIYENRKANGWDTNRLEEVIAAMECIENAMQQAPVPDAVPDAVPDSGPDPDSTPTPEPAPEPVACVSPQLRADAKSYSEETWRESPDHVERWLRVLQTFSGTANDSTVVTPAEAEEYVNRGWERWVPVLEALKCMEQQALDSS